MRWEKHVACMVKLKNAYTNLAGKPEKKYHLREVSIAGRAISRCTLKKQGVRLWPEFSSLRIGSSGSLL
jgi:hypothetical protein